MVSWADRLRRARERRGLSQREAAERIGVSPEAVYKWEAGEHTPTARNQRRVRDLLGVPIREGPNAMEGPADGWGAKVRKARRERGWSQEELARRVGVAESQPSYWEAQGGKPYFANRVRVCLLLDVPLGMDTAEVIDRAAEMVLACADSEGPYEGPTADEVIEAHVCGDTDRWGELMRAVRDRAEQLRPDVFNTVWEGAA